ncbi:MAG: peptidoglycan-binding protein, partial [Okeania sp. SIO2D1]|nr:peptidoglycan-binding protein [Okeania sp. SIO2D1]
TGQDPDNAPTTSTGTGGSTTEEQTKPDATILKLQKTLNRLQIRDSRGKALLEDGWIGPATRSATAKFNQIMGFGSSGNAGLATWDALEAILEKPILWENHAQGAAVRYVQFRISTDVDGIYGPGTAEAVKTFQTSRKIDVDGVIGPQSWEKLIG